MKTVVLASASPRRKQLLRKTGLKYVIDPSHFEEIIKEKLPPIKLAERLSLEKAKTVVPRHKNALIIAADTLVVIKNHMLGKPQSSKSAIEMLELLNGREHSVITGLTIYDTDSNKFVTKSVKSKVYFNSVSKKEIENYVFSKKPLDKAGGYGIQELPKIFIKKTEGDYDNIVGLPIASLIKELKKFGVK